MSIYDDLQGVARGLLTEFNQGVVKLIKMTPGTGPAENPGPSTPNEITIPGAVVRGVIAKYVTLGLAQSSDLQVTASVLVDGTRAALTDRLSIDGKIHKIIQVIQMPAAGTPVAFVYIARAGAV